MVQSQEQWDEWERKLKRSITADDVDHVLVRHMLYTPVYVAANRENVKSTSFHLKAVLRRRFKSLQFLLSDNPRLEGGLLSPLGLQCKASFFQMYSGIENSNYRYSYIYYPTIIWFVHSNEEEEKEEHS